MAIEVDFPPHVELLLREEATRRGMDVVNYIRDVVQRELIDLALARAEERTSARSLDDLRPRVPPRTGTNGLGAVFGQWPGDETDEEILRALEELS